MIDDSHDETPEEAIENYNAWIELALQKAERGEWDEVHEMVMETPFARSYLFSLVRAYRELVERYDRQQPITSMSC